MYTCRRINKDLILLQLTFFTLQPCRRCSIVRHTYTKSSRAKLYHCNNISARSCSWQLAPLINFSRIQSVGKGWTRCLNCHGDGWMHDSSGARERCFYCQHSKHGHGQQDCNKCGSKGKVNCATCDGHGQIRCYIQLSITWKTNTAEHIIERLDLPSDLIR